MEGLRAGWRPERMKTLGPWINGLDNGTAQMDHDCSCAVVQSQERERCYLRYELY